MHLSGFHKKVAFLLLANLFILLAGLAWGSTLMSWEDFYSGIIGSPASSFSAIIWQIRFPRIVAAMLAGMALSVSGLLLQTLFKNPLAGPGILGVTAGGSLGVGAFVFISGSLTLTPYWNKTLGWLQSWSAVSASIVGSGMVLAIMLFIAARVKDAVSLLITGLMIGNITIALVSIWQFFSSPDQLQEYILWTLGSFQGVTLQGLPQLTLLILSGSFISLLLAHQLNLMLLGDTYAQSLGLSIKHLRLWLIGLSAILSGTITAFCGPIAFVGVAIPHLGRSWLKEANHHQLLPVVALTGSAITGVCSLLTVFPSWGQTLPVNALTTLLGAPVVIWVILRNQNLHTAF